MTVVLLAAVCMFVQDVAGTLMVQAEARNHGLLAGFLDCGMWSFGILTTTFSVTTLSGHDLGRKIGIFCAVNFANVVGAVVGVRIGRRLLKADDT